MYLVLVERVQWTSDCVYSGCTMASKANMVPIFVELTVQLGRETLTMQKYE